MLPIFLLFLLDFSSFGWGGMLSMFHFACNQNLRVLFAGLLGIAD